MNVNNIDEVEALINKYRAVMTAKELIEEINGEDGGDPNTFILVDKDTQIEVPLRGLKADILESIVSVLNDQYDKITARMKEI